MTSMTVFGNIQKTAKEEISQARDILGSFGNWLPYIQLLQPTSGGVDDNTPAGTFTFTKDQKIESLGKVLKIVPISLRTKATEKIGEKNFMNNFDVSSEQFQAIKAKAEMGQMNGAMWGGEWLVWLPEKATFATFFMCSKTSRSFAPELLPFKGVFVEVSANKKKNTKGQFFVMEVTISADPAEAEPALEQLNAEIEKFDNPPADNKPQPVAAETTETAADDNR